MSEPGFKIGCQTYTWEMLGAAWTGTPDDLVQAIADGGYQGIEITTTMIGDYATRPRDFAGRLADAGLTLVALATGSASGFTEPDALDRDLDEAKRWIDFTAQFPKAVLSLGSATSMSEGPRDLKFATAADVYNRIAEIGGKAGVVVAVHPSSHHDTLLFDRADYEQIFAALEPRVGWVPDTGHMIRGGIDLADAMRSHSDRIIYVHLKDADRDGNWTMLGEGVCDISVVSSAARAAKRFNGWLVIEEESVEAGRDPAAAVRRNRETIRTSMGL